MLRKPLPTLQRRLLSTYSSATINNVIHEQVRYVRSAAHIRHLTKVLKHKRDAQTEVYTSALEVASQLEPKIFVEVGSATSDDEGGLTSMPLSGAIVAVSDVIDVQGFSTRYDVRTKMLHKVPRRDQPFIGWLRLQGARVSGKLVGSSPICFEETADMNLLAAAVAIEKKACHYAILNSFVGSAGLSASHKYDVVTFKPACNSLDDRALRFPSTCGSMSIMASRLDDIVYLWEVYTGTITKIEALTEKYSNEAALASMAAAAAQQSGGSASAYEQAARIVAEAMAAPPTLLGRLKHRLMLTTSFGFGLFKPRDQHVHAFTSSWQQRREGVLKVGIPIALINENGGDTLTAASFESKLKKMYEQLRIARKAGRKATSEEEDEKSILNSSGEDATAKSTAPAPEAPIVSSPTTTPQRESLRGKWRRLWSGSNQLDAMASQKDSTRRDYRIDFIPVHLNIDLGGYVTQIQKIADYELTQIFLKEAASRQQQQGLDGSLTSTQSNVSEIRATTNTNSPTVASPTSSVSQPTAAQIFGTGLFEELPQSIVSTLFDGREISPVEYARSVQLAAERTSSTIDEVFVDVDILCLPILSEPMISGNIRNSSFSIPFVTNGNPIVTLNLGQDTSVMLIGELGRSTQLLEDAMSFVDLVKGEAPAKWWQRALFGQKMRP